MPAKDISRVLRALASSTSRSRDRDAVLVALDAFDRGLDFAAALHMACSSRASAFVAFDPKLAKRAEAIALPLPVELLARSVCGSGRHIGVSCTVHHPP